MKKTLLHCFILINLLVLLQSCTRQYTTQDRCKQVQISRITHQLFDSDIYLPNDFSDSFDKDSLVGKKPQEVVFGSTTKTEHCYIVDKDTIQPKSLPYSIRFHNNTDHDMYIGKSSGEYFSRGEIGLSFFIDSDQKSGITFYVQSFDPDSANPITLKFRISEGTGVITDVLNNRTYKSAFKPDTWNDVLFKLHFNEQKFDMIVNNRPIAENIRLKCSPQHKFSRFLIYQPAGSTVYYDDFIVKAAPQKAVWKRLKFAHTELEFPTTPGNRYKVFCKDKGDKDWHFAEYFDAASTETKWLDIGDHDVNREHPGDSSVANRRYKVVEHISEEYLAEAPSWIEKARIGFLTDSDGYTFYSDSALHKKCQEIVAQGFNSVIMESQFEWGWHRMGHPERWDEVLKRIQHVTQIAHCYGIRVIEHHSWGFLMVHTLPKSFRGIDLVSLGAIDWATKEPAWRSNNTILWYCPNNPTFRKWYSEYLIRLMKETDVDALAPDDVEIPYGPNVCGCQYCITIFRDDTGMNLPGMSDETFWGNLKNPKYIRWMQLRSRATGDCYAAVRKACDTVRPDLPWMQYDSSPLGAIHAIKWARPMEDIKRGGSQFLGLEAMGKEDHRLRWQEKGAIMKYCEALTRSEGWPFWSMTYSHPDITTLYEGWATTVSFGGREWTCMTASHPPNIEKGPLFEKQYQHLYFKPRCLARIAVLHSPLSLECLMGDDKKYLDEFKAWCAVLLENHFAFDVIQDDDLNQHVLKKYSGLVLPRAACLTEKGANAIKRFIKDGGVIVSTSDLGNRDSLGRILDKPLMQEITDNRDTAMNFHTGTVGKGRWLWWPKMITSSGTPDNKIFAQVLSENDFDKGPVKALNIVSSVIVNSMVVETGELVIHVIDSTLLPEQKDDLTFEIDGLHSETVSIISPDWAGTRKVDVVNRNRITVPREWLDVYLLVVAEKYKN